MSGAAKDMRCADGSGGDAGVAAPVCYVCKYTPVELLAGFGCTCKVLDERVEGFDRADRMAHPNLCGFGRSVIEAVLAGKADQLVLVNCCDAMRRIYDIAKASGACRFLYLLDLPHKDGCCQQERFARSLHALADAYASYSGKAFDRSAFFASFADSSHPDGPYIGIFGARAGHEMAQMAGALMPLPVRDLTCVGNREVRREDVERADSMQEDAADGARQVGVDDAILARYAAALLGQMPCRRMDEHAARRQMAEDPSLKAAIYHTIRFCDFYGNEYHELHERLDIPLCKIETDFSKSSEEQLRTRFEAFAESLNASGVGRLGDAPVGRDGKDASTMRDPSCTSERGDAPMVRENARYMAGIDSGSSSTDVVVLDAQRRMVTSKVIPTGGGARLSAERCLEEALADAGIPREQVGRIVTTGYGRDYVEQGDNSVTEITCHARGAHFLDPRVRTIIDIGGQDSKAIRVDETGAVQDFAMNDKCAAGTGRFLEKTAEALGLTLAEMSTRGLGWKHDVTISSTCTVFAESEVVTLVAQNVAVADIVHGLDKAIASKTAALVGRVKPEGAYMMTGGVAHNAGVVRALEERLGVALVVCEEAQLAGALGAALIAWE